MKQIYGMALAAGLLAFGAAAQDSPKLDQMKMQFEKLTAEAKVMSVGGGIMGPAVKGAPYSADEVRETTQVLGDGTRIHNESKTTVYRDSQGRVRRETPDEISIWDPASGMNYVLNPKTMQAHEMTLHFTFNTVKTGTGVGMGTGTGTATMTTSGEQRHQVQTFVYSSKTGEPPMVVMSDLNGPMGTAEAGGVMVKRATKLSGAATRESLGSQSFDGVKADGERVTSTLEVGAIGNDRPIQTTSERWYSSELQTVVMSKRSDPRMGDEVFKLTNIHRGEPSSVMFEVPPGYTIVTSKNVGK